MAEPRKRLTDILPNSDRDRLERAWSITKAADDLRPLPAGDYKCRILSGELFNSKGGTPGYKLALEVCDGEHAGRRVWHDIWLSEAALSMAKRDLAKLGVVSLKQLEQPLPEGIILDVKLVLRRGDDRTERNHVRSFEVVGIEKQEPDPFAPSDAADGSTVDDDGFNWKSGEQRDGEPTP